MQRDRIVDSAVDPERVEMAPERDAAIGGDANDELVPDGARVGRWQRDGDAGEPFVVERRQPPAFRRPARQVWELDPQQRSLQLVETEVPSQTIVPRLFRGAVVPDLADRLCERAVVRHDRAAIAEAAQVLRGEERERGGASRSD